MKTRWHEQPMERLPRCLSDLRVLVIDGSGNCSSMLLDALGVLAVSQVTWTEDAVDGLAMLQDAGRFHVAILDLDSERMDGMEFISLVARRDAPAFILMSSHDEELQASVHALVRKYGVNILGLLSKPLDLHRLAYLLSSYGGRHAEATRDDGGQMYQAWSADDLAAALECKQFIPFFQPQIELATGRVTSVEVLARWNHPELGLLPASQFIDVMEQTKLIDRLFHTLLRQSLEYARQWDARGWPIGLAINVSPSTLQNSSLPNQVSDMVRQHGICAGRVTLELTETAMTRNPIKLLETMIRLRLRGFKLSVDDFGTGYSSLQQLSEMPFTEIKIDRSLVTGISGSRKATAIMESIVALANKLDMCTVAEGIECANDRDLIRALGCRFGQAYYFARPMGNAELVGRLDQICV
jgi:EAL domain-containing protein (putative c-di-GMP-specific phosphodiesterase class I)